MARAKESRKKCCRLIEEIAATENRDVIRREVGHILQTCMALLTPAEQAAYGICAGPIEHVAERQEAVAN